MRRWAFTANKAEQLNLAQPYFSDPNKSAGAVVNWGAYSQLFFSCVYTPDDASANDGVLASYVGSGGEEWRIKTDNRELVFDDGTNTITLGEFVDAVYVPHRIVIVWDDTAWESWILNLNTGALENNSGVKSSVNYSDGGTIYIGRDGTDTDQAYGLIRDTTFGFSKLFDDYEIYLSGGFIRRDDMAHWPMREGSGDTFFDVITGMDLENSLAGSGGIRWSAPDPRQPKRWV